MTVPGPEFDKFRAEADLTQIVTDEWTGGVHHSMTLNGEKYRFAYMEEVPDDPTIFIVRESDGLILECEVWVSIYPSVPPDIRKTEEVAVAEAPGGEKPL